MTDSRIGILGGTFNPPHIGHLVMAQEARDQLGLDRVVFMPVAVPPHKEADGDPGADVRLALTRLAADGEDGVEVSTAEIDRGGPSFTVDTLTELHERDPEQELTFIVGGDMAHSLPAWREPERVLELARLAVAEREGIAREDIAARLAPLHDGTRVAFFDMPRIDVSSSAVRRRVAEGRPVRHLVPDAVAEAIADHGCTEQQLGDPPHEPES
jgi:nicotinate-nucleotide adenylyltransferase